MAMIYDLMEDCCFINHSRVDDAFGSSVETWTDGATFKAAIIKNNATEAIVAEKQGITEIFTVVIEKGFVLDYHDAFRRLSDGQIFRITAPSTDNDAPAASSIPIAKATAEKWVIPSA